MKVLLLDDNSDQLMIRGEILRRAKIASHEVETALGALDLLRQGGATFGVVVTDHFMPGMSGVEFVRELRSFNKGIPVIVMSGLPDADEEYSGLDVVFLLKPCEPEGFVAMIKTALAGSEKRASA